VARPWEILESVPSPEGTLELRRRGDDDFLIAVGPRVLMTSRASRSEERLAQLACEGLRERPGARVLIGGLGLGYTLRTALDALREDARVVVAEIEPAVVRWCRGPCAGLSRDALADARVSVEVADVAKPIAAAKGSFDAIALDLFEGPRGDAGEAGHPLYGDAALGAAAHALTPGGVLTIWSEEAAPAFERRLARAGFDVRVVRAGRGGRRHPIYVARRV
jgi:spermidine synthase